MRVGFGYSTLEDSYSAGFQAIKDAVSKSGEPSIIILFSTFNHDPQEIFKGVKEVAKDSKLIGATSECIIVNDMLISKGVSVLTVSGDDIKAVTFSQCKEYRNDSDLGKIAGESLLKSNIEEGLVIIFFPNGLIDVSKMLYGLYNTMGPRFKYVGGGCSHSPKSSNIYTFTEKGVNKGSLVAALISGLEFSTTTGHGFDSIKEPLIITETHKNKITEIDGIPAVDAYIKRFEVKQNRDLLPQIVLHPLGFPNLSGDYVIRDPVRIYKDGSIEFPTDIPKGAVGYVMQGRIDKLTKNTSFLSKEAIKGVSEPKFAIIFDCISRHSLMKDKFKLELKAIKDAIEKDIPITGMLSWGEIGCYKSSPMYHNKTTVVAIAGRGQIDKEISEDKVRKRAKILNAELSILHEIASFSFSGSEGRFAQESIEKTIRLFGARRSALIKKVNDGYKLLSAWGFQDVNGALEVTKQNSLNRIHFMLGKDGRYGILFLEMDKPIREQERRIYTIFAKRLEEMLGIIEAINQRVNAERILRKLALTDELTKLYNRRGFLLLGEQYIKLTERLKRKAILLYMDVDNMKWINDNLGHSEGDKVLVEIASILRKTSRKSDILARIGGDEFVFLGLETGSNSYTALTRRINERIENRNRKSRLPYKLSLSIGVAVYDPNNPSSLKELLEKADKNMYEEKRGKKLRKNAPNDD